MKEHVFFRPLFKGMADNQNLQQPALTNSVRPDLNDIAQLNTPPCIVVRGFRDLHHFLSWFHIHLQQPIIFPANQGRYVKQEMDCITICGFSNLKIFYLRSPAMAIGDNLCSHWQSQKLLPESQAKIDFPLPTTGKMHLQTIDRLGKKNPLLCSTY